jgi:transcriptional regulator with XRE-family HTH domain
MISMKEIARVCGVSVATVSKALSDKGDISKATRDRIRQAAEEMGYMLNASARALKTNRTYSIGVIFVDRMSAGLSHEYFSQILESFRQAAEENGYDISFINNRVDGAWETGFDGSAQYFSDYYVHNASFFKLDKITLSKMFQFGKESKLPMNLSAFFTVQNVATITGYKGIDPEIFNGIDNNMYPRPRTFILGVRFNF